MTEDKLVKIEAEIKEIHAAKIEEIFEEIKKNHPSWTIEKLRGDLIVLGIDALIKEGERRDEINKLKSNPMTSDFMRKCGF